MESGSTDQPNGGGRRRRGIRPRGGIFRQRRLLPKSASNGEPAPRTKPKLRKLRMALVLGGLALLAFVSWIFGIMMAVAQDLPALENRQQYERAENSIVYDVNGEKLATLTNNQGRILLESDEIALSMKQAVVAIEDTRFYDHRGVDFQGIGRALYQDILSGSTQQGASTITQQFVKNALAAQDSRTLLQKFREAAIAYHLERQWSKEKILTEYLNEIYFGEGATGIEAAARTYFGSDPDHAGCGQGEDSDPCASELYPWEAALLAGIISSPSAYSPRANPIDAKARRDLVLDRMAEQGYITAEEAAAYKEEPIPDGDDILPPSEDSEAPYFTSWLRQQLVDRYGAGEAFGGGLRIQSTLDLDLQRAVESSVYSRVGGIAPTSSVVVLDNDTAAVRAMVGGFDFQKAPFNLATNGQRQPGSAFKPFTLTAALEAGHSTSEVYASQPVEIPFTVKVTKKNGKTQEVPEVFDVNNYEDSYLGSASLATATTYSDNSVFAQLGMQVGPQNVAATAEKMGIETDLSSDVEYSIEGGPWQPYNPAMILGGLSVGVTPLEMAHAYNTLAAGGKRISGTMAAGAGGPVGITRVVDSDSEDFPEADQAVGEHEFGEATPVSDQTGASGENEVVAKQVIDPAVASTVTDVLSTVVSSGTGENAATGEPTWGKTGTTDDNGDAWFCGATEQITVCVWVGHADSNTPMLTEYGGAPVDGGTIPALIFADIVDDFEALEAARKEGEDPKSDDLAPSIDTESSSVPATDSSSVPATESGATEAVPPTDTAPADAGGASDAAAAPSSSAPAPSTSGGGVAPG